MIGWFSKLAAARGMKGGMQRGGGQFDMASYDRPGARGAGNPNAPPSFTPTMPGKQGAFLSFMQSRGIGGYGMRMKQQQRQEAIDKYRFMIGMN